MAKAKTEFEKLNKLLDSGKLERLSGEKLDEAIADLNVLKTLTFGAILYENLSINFKGKLNEHDDFWDQYEIFTDTFVNQERDPKKKHTEKEINALPEKASSI